MQFAPFAAFAAHQLRATVGQHFVDVHIALRAGTRLPDRQRELARMLAFEDFVGSLHDGGGLVSRQLAQRTVDGGSGALALRHCRNQLRRHALGRDGEVVQRALRLRTPQAVARHVDRAKAVFLNTVFHRSL
jgi:hypothetical protein